ncbi:MAG: hypothetical protein COW00_13615 [Bdellovibrio sp. CG12_big_fil_rev_8_21_14_0_65_39_13]|nr:MAG: hypothetical protein COW78_07040 [Bdellovibrio sp. CG22_combo_CG10-13_8_21_14_all_39_27]PIQ58654.1 MAG: hypothetical protein COW00_13615 [Bdellovibrio sp. CG12_big_fil_rev_8_21_14_0_65_39_13]PIR33029.1 MAG: hypothetical protein COV37_18210 [Bdellovibrio sp. CG11_big_fil_rev_8_21_14_0_20_39_38]
MDALIYEMAEIIRDYQHLPPGSVEDHVRNWIMQFPKEVQYDLMDEMVQLMKKHYISQESLRSFLKAVLHDRKNRIRGGVDPVAFWRGTTFLDIQSKGNSQKDLLEELEIVLAGELGIDIDECDGSEEQRYLYIDDGMFSGTRIKNDLKEWISDNSDSLEGLPVRIIVITAVAYSLAEFFLKNEISDLGKELNLDLKLEVLASHWLSNFKKNCENSDVLWPNEIPNNAAVQEFYQAENKTGKVILRTGELVGGKKVFSSPGRRKILEQQLLIESVKIRNSSGYFGKGHRPLGFTQFPSFGFGATIVTYRNCPNNCPLAFWASAGDWMALFPRKNN